MQAKVLEFIKQNALVLLLAGMFGYYIYTHENNGAPVPIESPVKIAATQYRRGLSATYRAAGDAVKSGQVASHDAILNFVNARSAGPMQQTMESAFAPGLGQAKKPGEDQPIINPAVVAQALYDVAEGVK